MALPKHLKFDYTSVTEWMVEEGKAVLSWAGRELAKNTWPGVIKLTMIWRNHTSISVHDSWPRPSCKKDVQELLPRAALVAVPLPDVR